MSNQSNMQIKLILQPKLIGFHSVSIVNNMAYQRFSLARKSVAPGLLNNAINYKKFCFSKLTAKHSHTEIIGKIGLSCGSYSLSWAASWPCFSGEGVFRFFSEFRSGFFSINPNQVPNNFRPYRILLTKIEHETWKLTKSLWLYLKTLPVTATIY